MLLSRTSLSRAVAAALLTGLVAGAFAVLFRVSLEHGLAFVLGTDDTLQAFRQMPTWKRLMVPAVGGTLAGAISALVAGRRGHAMADIMEAVALGRGEISVRRVLPKSLASWFALVSGGSLGREGSILQFGAAFGDNVGDWLGLPARTRRALVAAGTAAGFAAAYNTPMAAIVFVVEVITGIASLEILLPVILATTVATALTRYAIGGVPLYGQRSFALTSDWELLAHALLGLAAGVVGPIFLSLLFGAERRLQMPIRWRPLAAGLGGLAVGGIAVFFPEVAGNGFEAIQETLDGRLVGPILLALLGAKALATVASVSTGSPGGVFTPSMFLGAALGGAVGGLVPVVLPTSGPPGGYALVGMAAMLAATTHAPLMAATIAFELSGDYAIVLPLLLATGIGAFVSRARRVDSVYTEELRRRGVHWQGSLAQRLARAVHAEDILLRGGSVLPAGTPIDEGLRILEDGARAVYVSGTPLRAITLSTARPLWAGQARGESLPATVGDVAEPVQTATPEDDLLLLSEKLWKIDEGQIPVVGRDGRILGVVTRRDVLGAIDREVLDRDILLTRIVRQEGSQEAADFLELPPGWMVETVSVPPHLVGRIVDHHALPGETGLLVVAVRPKGHGPLVDATGRTLRANDLLVVIGPAAAIETFEGTRSQPTSMK